MILTNALDAADTHRFEMGIKISKGGAPSLFDGTPHSINRIRGTGAPRAGSDVLSVLVMASEHASRVTRSVAPGTQVGITACWSRERPEAADFRSYVATSPAGSFQFTGTVSPAGRDCYELHGSPLRGMFFGWSPSRAGYISVVPVRSEYSIFVDRSSQLRLVSHVGNRIIESQPLIRGIERLQLNAVSAAERVSGVHIAVKATGRPTIEWTHLYTLSRTSLWNEVFM
jgi:hypothetical protein